MASEKNGFSNKNRLINTFLFSLLDQPVHNSGSSSYSSLNRNDHLVSTTSSSESLENCKESKMREVEEEFNGKARPVSEAVLSQFRTVFLCLGLLQCHLLP